MTKQLSIYQAPLFARVYGLQTLQSRKIQNETRTVRSDCCLIKALIKKFQENQIFRFSTRESRVQDGCDQIVWGLNFSLLIFKPKSQLQNLSLRVAEHGGFIERNFPSAKATISRFEALSVVQTLNNDHLTSCSVFAATLFERSYCSAEPRSKPRSLLAAGRSLQSCLPF